MKPSSSGKQASKPKQLADPGDGVPALVRRIKAGEIAVAGLSKELRVECVEHLTAEGLPTSEVAELLGVGARTIRRDLRAIRAANSVERNPETVRELVGRLVLQADSSVSRIRRAIRSKSARVADRVDGERTCWRIVRELVEALQRLGLLPTAALELRGDVRHRISLEVPGWDELEAELDRLEMIESEHEPDGQRLAQIGQLKAAVKGLAVVDQVESLALTIREERNDEEE